MTQYYVVGELSALIGELCPNDGSELATAVRDLRRRVECAPACGLTRLAAEALEVADAACWALLERGDVDAFAREVAEASLIREFATCAALLP